MASNQQFCLRWNNHQSTLISVFDHLLESGTLVDCTLAAEGQFLKAHKVVLSACSPYLEALLSQHYEKHPIIILKDVSFHELKAMLDYMYRGEVNISQEQLGTFLKAAESLQIKGLTDSGAISENRDFERSREMDHVREFNRSNRSVPTSVPKKMDMILRKQLPILPRPISPLVNIPSNLMINADQRKSTALKHPLMQEFNQGSTNMRIRDGSVSPTTKRKRQFPPYLPPSEETNSAPLPVENNHEENQQIDKIKESIGTVPQNSSDAAVPTALVVNKKHAKIDETIQSESAVESAEVKREVKTENMDFSDVVQNDDSVEDLTVDEEEEEMDELDLSRPGPSNMSNSQVAGIPWHSAGEGNGEDMLLAAQQDSQDGLASTHMLLTPDIYARLLGSAFASARTSVGLTFNCPRCGNTYARPHSLSRHIRFECGVDPKFECPICHKKSKHKHNLMLHMRTHQNR
ncbi:longitudinals lacking protein-like isoform X5 [Homalodisca vitripennis]|uniref:longitudinals lacking protein-like isoform X5 n=1 Tax=Homalodisca vitripennis TaxID=197043 RepID=UPI001EECA070|nr:longitudinals lacking protein-like isoform X5 [Homalodisca vitripennis]